MAGERWTFTKQQIINTPSRKAGIEEEKELSYRQQAANFIQDMGQRLQVQQLVINTAIVYMHRFYMFHSFVRFHRNQIATASIFLAAKVEEQPRKLEHVIKVAHVCLHREGPPIDTKSEAYLEQAQELVINENILLQTLGFQILVEHPHTFIVKTCHVVKASRDLSQTSYFLATNSLHLTTMCLQYSPGLVACLCIHLACTWSDWKLGKSQDGTEWYHYIDKTVTQEKLDELTKEFLSVIEKCPSKLRKKIMTWKAQSGQAGSQSPSATPSSSSHKRGHGESSSAAGSAAALERKKSQSPVKHKDSPAKPNKEGKHSSSRASTPGSSVSKSRPNTTQEDVKRTKSDANKAKNYKEYKELKERGLLPEKSSTLTNSSQHDNIFDQYKTPNVDEDVKHEKTSTLSKMEGEPQYRDSSPDHRERSRENPNVKQPHIKTDPNNSSSRHLAKVVDHTVKKMDSPSYPKIKLKHDYPDLSRVKQEVQDTKTEHSGSKSNSPRLKLKTEYPDLSKVKQESNPEPSLKMKIKPEPNTEPTLKIKIKKDQLSDAWRSEHKKNRHSDVHREKVKDPHRSNPGPSQGGPDHRSHNAPSQGGPDHRAHNAPSQGGPDHRSHNAHQPNLDYNVNSDKHFNKIKQDSGRDYAGHGPPGHPGGGGRPADRKDPYRRHSGSGDPAYTSRKRPLSSPDMGSRPPHGFTSPHKHPRNNTSRYDQRHDTNGRHSYGGYGQSRGPPPRGPPINDYGPPDRPKDPYEDMYEQEDVPVSRSSTSSYEDSYEEPYSHDYPR